MHPERWRFIEKLYHAALERDADARAPLLAAADPEIRREVEALLAQPGDGILDHPVAEAVTGARLDSWALLPPTRDFSGEMFSHFRVIAKLGSGGMGVVYRAEDLKLGRQVALKFLPFPAEQASAHILKRFEREARAASALNHPNICTIYGVEEFAGQPVIVMELVDGEPLRGAKFGLPKTLEIAAQIASALANAHDAGIVHRDLKPGNILLTHDGRVKILDFGLAKFTAVCPVAAEKQTDADTQTVYTHPGVIMGTFAYMSPEQVRGSEVDHRSDIFSFGLVVYELLSGRRAFSGDTSAEIMIAILKEEPPELPETVPYTLCKILVRCLEKEPLNRFQSARDLAFALSQVSVRPDAASRTSATMRGASLRLRRAVATAATAGVAALAVAAGHFLWHQPLPPSWHPVAIIGPEVAMTPRLSPDGHMLAFRTFEQGQSQVAVMKPESGNWSVLTHNRERGAVFEASWSSDGTRIFFDRWTDVPKGVYSVPVLGGNEQLILEDAMCPQALPDGSLLLVRLNAQRELRLFRFWPDNGRLQEFPLKISATSSSPRVFPNGREAVVSATLIGQGQSQANHLYAIDLSSGGVRRISTGWALERSLYGLAITRDGNSILAAHTPFQLATIPAHGNGLARNLLGLTNWISAIDTAQDGSIYIDQRYRPSDVVRFSANGGPTEKITELPTVGLVGVMLLPDGRVVVGAPYVVNRPQLLVVEPRKTSMPMVNTSEGSRWPFTLVGPDDIAFVIGQNTRPAIGLASALTGRVIRRIPFEGEIEAIASTPDGKTLYYAVTDASRSGGTVWTVPSAGGPARKIHSGDTVAVDPAGRYLAILAMEAAGTHVVRMPLHGGTEQDVAVSGPYRPIPLLGSNPIKDDRLLVSLCGPDLYFCGPGMIDLATGRTSRIPVNYPADFGFLSWTPDGHVIAAAQRNESTIWRFYPEAR